MHGYCAKWWLLSTTKKMKTERKSGGNFFISVFISCLKYSVTTNNWKIKSLCILSLYVNKLQNYLLILKTRKEVLTAWYQKKLLTLNMFQKNKQYAQRHSKKDEIKEIKLYNIIKFSCLFIFHQINLLLISFWFTLSCLLQSILSAQVLIPLAIHYPVIFFVEKLGKPPKQTKRQHLHW